MSGTLHLLIGPVGAGKSTHALTLCSAHDAVAMNLDAWMAELYGDDERPGEGRVEWYMARTARCTRVMWALADDLLTQGKNVVLEIGLIQQAARAAFYGQVDAAGHGMVVHVVDAPREVRRERVRRRNAERGATFSVEVPDAFFELASDLWEAPDAREQAERDLRFV